MTFILHKLSIFESLIRYYNTDCFTDRYPLKQAWEIKLCLACHVMLESDIFLDHIKSFLKTLRHSYTSELVVITPDGRQII